MDKKILLFILTCFVLFIIPVAFDSAVLLSVLITYLIYVLFASGLNITVGYLGELSFGHAVFFGVGAYAAVLWEQHMPGGFWIGAIIAMLLSAILALFISLIAFRTLSGIYFAIVTFGIAEIMRTVVLQWIDFTRGPMGISGIFRPTIPFTDFSLDDDFHYYYFVLIVVIIVVSLIYFIIHSSFGRTLISVRESPNLAQTIGINVVKQKAIAFILTGIISGLSGALFAYYLSVINPELLGLHYTTIALIIVIIGGRGTIAGPFLGAALYIILPELLDFNAVINEIVFAIVLLIFIIYMPFGLSEKFSKLASWLMRGIKRRETS